MTWPDARSRTSHRARHRADRSVGELRAHFVRVDPIAEHRPPVGHHAGVGRHHPHRVAVGLDDLRVGEDVEQRVEVLEVVRRLAEPAPGRCQSRSWIARRNVRYEGRWSVSRSQAE